MRRLRQDMSVSQKMSWGPQAGSSSSHEMNYLSQASVMGIRYTFKNPREQWCVPFKGSKNPPEILKPKTLSDPMDRGLMRIIDAFTEKYQKSKMTFFLHFFDLKRPLMFCRSRSCSAHSRESFWAVNYSKKRNKNPFVPSWQLFFVACRRTEQLLNAIAVVVFLPAIRRR